MAKRSGKHGTVYWGGSEQSHVTNIQDTESVNQDVFNSNTSGGNTTLVMGAASWNGTFEVKDFPSFRAGDSAVLYVSDFSNSFYGTVGIISIARTIDVATGVSVGWTVTFQGDGAKTLATSSAPS